MTEVPDRLLRKQKTKDQEANDLSRAVDILAMAVGYRPSWRARALAFLDEMIPGERAFLQAQPDLLPVREVVDPSLVDYIYTDDAEDSSFCREMRKLVSAYETMRKGLT